MTRRRGTSAFSSAAPEARSISPASKRAGDTSSVPAPFPPPSPYGDPLFHGCTGVIYRLCLHQHARSASIGIVIHLFMLILRIVPDVHRFQPDTASGPHVPECSLTAPVIPSPGTGSEHENASYFHAFPPRQRHFIQREISRRANFQDESLRIHPPCLLQQPSRRCTRIHPSSTFTSRMHSRIAGIKSCRPSASRTS